MTSLFMLSALFLGDITPAVQPAAVAQAPVAPVAAPAAAQATTAQNPVAQVSPSEDLDADEDFLEGEDTLDEEIALLDGGDDLIEDDEDQ
ncbi:MAG: hypothetical protein HYX48_05430 [Chlamydiales bacterium]|nr:hypothetical protein [Chlamydiales bacterium]